jgi:hypothetical protein
MKFSSEVLSIIEGGLEGDVKKVRAYAQLMADKMKQGDHMKRAIMRRLNGSYKSDPILEGKHAINEKDRHDEADIKGP